MAWLVERLEGLCSTKLPTYTKSFQCELGFHYVARSTLLMPFNHISDSSLNSRNRRWEKNLTGVKCV